jgi:pyruvate formate lyase activating enzyme
MGEKVERWELCAFNNLCRDKYRRLDLEWAFARTSLMTPPTWRRPGMGAGLGLYAGRVFVTGAARVEN